jgi:hypothetical protein
MVKIMEFQGKYRFKSKTLSKQHYTVKFNDTIGNQCLSCSYQDDSSLLQRNADAVPCNRRCVFVPLVL